MITEELDSGIFIDLWKATDRVDDKLLFKNAPL